VARIQAIQANPTASEATRPAAGDPPPHRKAPTRTSSRPQVSTTSGSTFRTDRPADPHQALPSAFDRTLNAYRALETLLADGKVRAIGVSNFMVEHLTRLLDSATVVPAINQIEAHPYFQQRDVQDFGAESGILTQAWSPIGGITFYRDGSHGSTLDDPVIADVATAHAKTAAQVMLRWGLQHGRCSVIPKSTKPSRSAENVNVFDFELSAEEVAAIDGLDTGRRGGPEPDAITLEAFGREIPKCLMRRLVINVPALWRDADDRASTILRLPCLYKKLQGRPLVSSMSPTSSLSSASEAPSFSWPFNEKANARFLFVEWIASWSKVWKPPARAAVPSSAHRLPSYLTVAKVVLVSGKTKSLTKRGFGVSLS
jgi:hypothetical protein